MSDSGSYDIISDGSSGDSFVYLDADGNVIVMDDSGSDADSIANPPLEMKEYVEDPVEFERERLLARERLEATMGRFLAPSPAGAVAVEGRTAVAVVTGGADNTVPVDTAKEPEMEDVTDEAILPAEVDAIPPIANDNAAGDGGDGDGAEGEWCPPEDEWILEHILDRRVLKGGEGGSDYKDFYDDFGEKKSGMMAAGRVEYLCKWKWYEEPTWESRERVEDDYFMELRAYEKEIVKAKEKEAADRLASAAHKEKMAREEPKESDPLQVPKRLTVPLEKNGKDIFFGNDEDITSIVGIFPRDIAERFALSGAKMVGYGCCASQVRIDEFLRKYQALVETHRPAIVFHSCKPCQLERVALFGPRSGVCRRSMPRGRSEFGMPSPNQVAMCGTGIYRSMFVCVGLVGNSTASGWMDAEGALVFTDNTHLLPLWLVDFVVGTEQAVLPVPNRHYLSPMTIRYRAFNYWAVFDHNSIQDITFKGRKRNKESRKKVNRINRMAERNADQ